MTTTWLAQTDAAAVGEIAGRPVALHFGDVAQEFAALRRGAMLVDRSQRTRTEFAGAKAAELLTGLVTNDVLALTIGQGQYAAALTPKGKIIADARLFVRPDTILVDVAPRAAEGWMTMVRKFVNPRIAKYVDRTAALHDIGIFGTVARRIVAHVLHLDPAVLEPLAPYAHLETVLDGETVLVARVPDAGLEGYELFVPESHSAALWQRLVAAGATPAGLDAWEIARIEAGRPEWGIDIDDSTIPQEANFDDLHAISYTKGCYTGQETVARVHFRGHVNRHLRGLRYDASTPLPQKAALVQDDGKVVGDVRSSVISPRLGGIALAMARREVPLGAALRATWEGGSLPVTILALPFEL